MFLKKYIKDKLVFYSDKIPEAEHFFTTRGGGFKEGNTDLYCEYLGIREENLVHPKQVHSTEIKVAKLGDNDYYGYDSIILTNDKQAVYLNFADCTPVILYDKKLNIGAVAHAGWRGTAGRIGVKTFEVMKNEFGSSAEDVFVIIGSAIGGCCYAVGDEVVDGIKGSVRVADGLIMERGGERFVDLKGVNAQQLAEIGIPKENIDISPFCTCCDNDLFYSYRKENGTKSRHHAVLKLRG